jgi:diphosphomevalonate decarboxylase
MKEDFHCQSVNNFPLKGNVTWTSPSNIALVKYWGKKPVQLPANPSLSFTLNNCFTETSVTFEKSSDFSIELYVDGIKNSSFLEKIEVFIERIKEFCPYIFQYQIKIETHNTFPHSSGIASSASGLSALALCLVSIERKAHSLTDENFFKKVSFISRLGSGSACRSIYGSLGVWGEHNSYKGSSNEYAIAYNDIDPIFHSYQDTILLVDKGKKEISSTLGHDLMNNHPYSSLRYSQANEHMIKLKEILKNGDLFAFIDLVEKEALTLHSMMMTSDPYFILMKPNTLSIIQKIWEIRNEKKLPICITLDAGANVHLLYPKNIKSEVRSLIENDLIVYCENEQYICDEVGNGPKLITEHYA